jgi:hypothetical protein
MLRIPWHRALAAKEVRIEADTLNENRRKPAKSDGIQWDFCQWLSVESSVYRWIPLAHQCPAMDAAIGQCRPLPISRFYLRTYYWMHDRQQKMIRHHPGFRLLSARRNFP